MMLLMMTYVLLSSLRDREREIGKVNCLADNEFFTVQQFRSLTAL